MSDCAVDIVRTCLANSRSLEIDGLSEGRAHCYSYNAATENLSPVSLCYICALKRAAHRSFITSDVVKVTVRTVESRLMMMS